MPTIRMENGSTISTIDSPTISADTDRIYATSGSGDRLVRWDLNPRAFSTEYIGRYEPEEPKVRYIKQYNYVPEQFQFHKVDNEEELYLGIELEIDNGGQNEANAQYIIDFMNSTTENVYCKHDGSLNEGFEIVTHPCTIEYHKQLPYKELFKELSKKGYRSHDTSTCGLHVHINRNFFGERKLDQDLNISKLLYLYEKYWSKVELIARRKSNRFATRFFLEEDDSPLDLYAKSRESDKYGAINLKHKNTIEIRIFKGTLNVDTFYSTLEFVNIMAHIAKETDIYNIQFVTWEKIVSRFSEELNQYIIDREEIAKKEEKEKVNQMINNRSSAMGYTSVSNSTPYTRFNDLVLNEYEQYQRAYEELARVSNQMVCNNSFSFEYETETYNQRRERSEEEQIQRQISEMRQLVRRSRNGLEYTNLNRQIAELENKLRRLRRNNQNR